MITMRIPMTLGQEPEAIDLEQALSQEQLYIHHRQLTVKQQQILYSRELLIFYVHRRYQMINTAKLTNPYTVSYLPTTMNQFEKLQQVAINVPPELKIGGANGGQTFSLKSVIIVETKKIVKSNVDPDKSPEIIVSCSALVETGKQLFTSTDGHSLSVIKYNPLNFNSTGDKIQALAWETSDSMYLSASQRGTLFIYHTNDSENINLFS
jgi:hypothetical protein